VTRDRDAPRTVVFAPHASKTAAYPQKHTVNADLQPSSYPRRHHQLRPSSTPLDHVELGR
jgi:hypothetical protein